MKQSPQHDPYARQKAIAGLIRGLTYREMQDFAAILSDKTAGTPGVADTIEGLLRAADTILKCGMETRQ